MRHVAAGMLTVAAIVAAAVPVLAQAPGRPAIPNIPQLPGPSPTVADVVYATTDSASRPGHLLDLYLPAASTGPRPVVIFSQGSAWMANNGRQNAPALAAELNKFGYAVAGVAVRTSAQATFPGQVYDVKAAIRWLRANAGKYQLNPDRIGIVGESSGGWLAAMAAVTGDVPELEGNLGVTGVSSAVQAAIAYYPPTDFLQMDRWALKPCDPGASIGPGRPFCHDAAQSPESRLIGCAIQTCAEKTELANPIRYISSADPPIMVVHGESDDAVPHAQGELLYQALNKACHDAVFISLPVAGHAVWHSMMTRPALVAAATRRSTSSNGCSVQNPAPYTPTWATIVEFLDRYLK
jgi:acetyl esterase/lipase